MNKTNTILIIAYIGFIISSHYITYNIGVDKGISIASKLIKPDEYFNGTILELPLDMYRDDLRFSNDIGELDYVVIENKYTDDTFFVQFKDDLIGKPFYLYWNNKTVRRVVDIQFSNVMNSSELIKFAKKDESGKPLYYVYSLDKSTIYIKNTEGMIRKIYVTDIGNLNPEIISMYYGNYSPEYTHINSSDVLKMATKLSHKSNLSAELSYYNQSAYWIEDRDLKIVWVAIDKNGELYQTPYIVDDIENLPEPIFGVIETFQDEESGWMEFNNTQTDYILTHVYGSDK